MRATRQKICGLMLVASLGASAWLAAPAGSAVSAKPHGLTLLINGKKLPITPFSGPDRYTPIKASTLRVKALWQGSLAGTGYKVVISTTEPGVRTYRTCSTGTTCVVPRLVAIHNHEEMSWVVKIMKVRGHITQILSGFMVCLVRNTTAS
jgi:hypothetical protein